MQALLSHCTALFSELSGHSGLLAVFLLGGLTGSLTHCLTMCGPLVASRALCGEGSKGRCSGCVSMPSDTVKRSLISQLPYHLGRATTYGALGFCVALLSQLFVSFAYWDMISAVMLVCAGGLFLWSSVSACSHPVVTRMNQWIGTRGQRVSGSFMGGYTRGVLLGFMPCGLLYAALMMAATLANPFAGMIAMWLFALGTMPALLMVSSGASLATQKWSHVMRPVGRAMLAINGFSLIMIAGNLVR